jgi:hypothetical protein
VALVRSRPPGKPKRRDGTAPQKRHSEPTYLKKAPSMSQGVHRTEFLVYAAASSMEG